MRDFTNLSWPEGPFGAELRPFGHRERMLAAVTVDWTDPDGHGVSVPVCVSSVYLRVHPGHVLDVSPDTLSIGFRATVIETPAEVTDLVDLLDRALVRARRHATILAGHGLGGDLARLMEHADKRLPGVTGIREAWADRTVKGRGLAQMIDTQSCQAGRPLLDHDLDGTAVTVPAGHVEVRERAVAGIARCLAVGLTAAVHAGRYRWEDTFRVHDAISIAGWDILSAEAAHTPTVSTS